jgi:hypothetical protein
MRKQGFITLYFDAEGFEKESGEPMDDAMLRDFGRDMNQQAVHLFGYEGWITGWTNIPEESDHVEDDNAVEQRSKEKHERN